jgi:hypothetical protein
MRQFFGWLRPRFVKCLTICSISAHGERAETAQNLDRKVFHLLNLEHGT